jgi:hypothetical protein
MSFLRPIQWYQSHADPVWPDGTFKSLVPQCVGAKSKAEMEEMLRQGYSMQEVLDHFMKHGRTEEEEQKALAQRLQVGGKLYWMLRQGYSLQEVLNHFMKHGRTEEEEQKALAQRLQVL